MQTRGVFCAFSSRPRCCDRLLVFYKCYISRAAVCLSKGTRVLVDIHLVPVCAWPDIYHIGESCTSFGSICIYTFTHTHTHTHTRVTHVHVHAYIHTYVQRSHLLQNTCIHPSHCPAHAISILLADRQMCLLQRVGSSSSGAALR